MSNDRTSGFEYDIAISFPDQDLEVARALPDGLGGLSVTYMQRQDKVAGRDGLSIFREVFLDQLRLVVVLFRGDWGRAGFTMIERHAIEERFLSQGGEFLGPGPRFQGTSGPGFR